MKDFKSYTPDDGAKKSAETADKSGQSSAGAQSAQGAQGGVDQNSAVEIAKILSRAMNGKSEGQILQQILSEAERGKRAGTLTNADLDNFYAALSPLLDGFKRQKLKQVIAKLKNIQ